MSNIKVYCQYTEALETTTEVLIDTSVSHKYPNGLIAELYGCDASTLGYIHEAIRQCKPVSLSHGIYTAWVESVISQKSGKIDKLTLQTTPFYRRGQTVTFESNKLMQDALIVPPNGGNAPGVIDRMEYAHLGGASVANLYIFFESCTGGTHLLDTRLGGSGDTIVDSYALNGDYQRLLLNFGAPTTTLSMGTFPVPSDLAPTLLKPRHVIYSSYNPSPVPPQLLVRLSAPTQSISTSWHTQGLPIACTGTFGYANSISQSLRVGNIVTPTNVFYSIDHIGFYPLTFIRGVSVGSNFGSNSVAYVRKLRRLVAVSLGKRYGLTGEIRFEPYSETKLITVGTASGLDVHPKAYYRLKVTTLQAHRTQCERLP